MSEFRLLGPVEVVHEGRTLPIGAPKQRCVLARLLLDPGRVVPTERLYSSIWGEGLPDAARKAVHVYVSNLRRALASVPDQEILTASEGYAIDIDHRRIDLHAFRELAGQPDARDTLTRAVGLWRGEPLWGLGTCPLRTLEGPRLTEERLSVIERLAALEISAGNADSVTPMLYDLTAAHPLRETGYGLLMRALAADGRLAEALAVFADVRELLLDQLGTEPSTALTLVHQELLHSEGTPGTDGGGTAGSAHTAPVIPVPAQLPARVPHLAGRDAELAQLRSLLENPSATGITITAICGYGGVGKTTLALAAAHAAADGFDSGQLFVDLGGSGPSPADPSEVLAGFLRAYNVPGERMPQRLADRTGLFRSLTAGKRVLLVLDDARDAEHVRPLLPGTAGCAVLLTSRARPAGLDGARVLALGELTEDESLQLIIQHVGADRVRAERNAAIRIVRQCGGVPLAVRVAAGRLSRPSWTLATFADRLSSTNLLDELHDGDLEVRTSFGLTYQRLDARSARVFRMLAIAGISEITQPAAVEMLGLPERELLRVLDGLVDLHLLDEPAPGRYRYHDLLRSFAIERSEEADSTDERVAALCRVFDHYAAIAMDAVAAMMPGIGLRVPEGDRPGFTGTDHAVDWLAAEHATVTNLALLVLRTADTDVLAGIVDRVAHVMVALGNYAEVISPWPSWEELARQLLRITERNNWPSVANRCHYVLAGIAARRRDDAVTEQHLEPVLADAREHGDQMAYGRAAAMLGAAHLRSGHLERAWSVLREALAAHRRTGYARGYGGTLVTLADLHKHRGDPAAAARCARAALRIESAADLGDPYLRMTALVALGEARFELGRWDDARTQFRRFLELDRIQGAQRLRHQIAPKLARLARTEEPPDRLASYPGGDAGG